MAGRKKKEAMKQIKIGGAPVWVCVLLGTLLGVLVLGGGLLYAKYSADARNALRDAKTLRLGLMSEAATQRALGNRFTDASQPGGVSAGLYDSIREVSSVSGDFRVLRTGEDGYELQSFSYSVGDVTILYDSEGTTWRATVGVPLITRVDILGGGGY